ncbi:MAG TPA: hypothetical protein V6D22_17605 [Candidatus Obscuribacterales bacterium]
MTYESEALRTAVDKFVHTTADFGRPLVEGDGGISRAANTSPEHAQAAAFVNGPLADMRKTFLNLVNCEEAGQFSGFLDHVREMANKKDENGDHLGPIYRLMLNLPLT